MQRIEVYYALDTEREFQDRQTADPSRPDMVESMSMGDILSAMQVNLDKARFTWYRDTDPYGPTMTFLRKVAALAVKAGEQFGMPERPL